MLYSLLYTAAIFAAPVGFGAALVQRDPAVRAVGILVGTAGLLCGGAAWWLSPG